MGPYHAVDDREPTMTSLRRILAGITFAVLAASCGSATTIGTDAGSAVGVIEAPTTTTPGASSVARSAGPTTTTTTAAPIPADPFETLVANIKAETDDLALYDEPGGGRAEFEFTISNPTYWGNPLALMIVDQSDDGRWLKVSVPVRPNGTEAWVRSSAAEITRHRYRAEVDVGDRSVRVWNGDDLVAETGAVVGADRTPTPVGRFFVNDLVEKWDGSAYGPWILSLSGFSEALDTFAGGVPVIAIHGTNRPELVGGAHSNGCIRIPNEVVRVLAETVPIGTPVDIVA
jgi:lipoprotein-anchoring transpeptidase ErfK/SrfK